jgi:methionyl-tRNA formyltransferase
MEECNGWIRENLDTIMIDFLGGKIIPIPQDKSLATWVPKRNLDDCLIDFSCSALEMTRLLRALVPPYPRPRFTFCGTIYEIVEAKVIYRPYICTTSRIVNIDNQGIWVKISDGLLIIQKLLNNGENVPYSQFRIGMRLN